MQMCITVSHTYAQKNPLNMYKQLPYIYIAQKDTHIHTCIRVPEDMHVQYMYIVHASKGSCMKRSIHIMMRKELIRTRAKWIH